MRRLTCVSSLSISVQSGAFRFWNDFFVCVNFLFSEGKIHVIGIDFAISVVGD